MVPLFWPLPIVAQGHGERKVPKSRSEISLRSMGSFVRPFHFPSRGTSHGDSLPRGTPSQTWTPSKVWPTSLEGLPPCLDSLPRKDSLSSLDSLPRGTPSLFGVPLRGLPP